MKTKSTKREPSEPSFMEGFYCKGDPALLETTVGGITDISPFLSGELHARLKTPLARWCARLNLSIHDRYKVDAALQRGEDMQVFAQRLIHKTSL